MSCFKLGVLFSFGLFLSPLRLSAEQQQSQSGVRRLYVVQPGAAGADGGVRVTSLSTRRGAAGQRHTYNVELSANFGGQVRTRRMGNQAASVPQVVRQNGQERSQQKHLMKLSGINVCGGQCCHGWSMAQGSQRCTKPNCIPQCQNGGMCLRPQLCICKSDSNGKACEEKHTPPFSTLPGNGPTSGHTSGHSVVPQQPIPQRAPPDGYASAPPSSNIAQMKLTVKSPPQIQPPYIQQHIHQQIQSMQPSQSQQYVVKQPKYYHTHTTHTQTHVQSQPERPIPLTVGHNPIHVGNHTGRIKVVFTPTICKLTCIGGRCHNNCKLGNTTTIISENGHATDTLTAPNFRVVVCHLPCMNGGKCSARDRCQCPPSFTGKFCQMTVQNAQQQNQQMPGGYSQAQVHSTHTLPLSYSHGQSPVFSPSIVNVHINHPPEASVQVHQVSQLDNYQTSGHQMKGSQSSSSSSTSYSFHTERSQKIQHHGYNIVFPSQHGYQVSQDPPFTSKNRLGRCFQETAGSQCGKALPGLTKQEQCCATIGTSWGFHKCQKCPNKPSIPLIDCPQGYKRINSSHCQDLNECQLHGVCLNGRCLNTIGSYRCMCNPGYVPDPTLTLCISKFKEICPGGMGYTVLPNPPVNKPVTISQAPIDLLPPETLPTTGRPVEAFWKPEDIIPEVVERSSPPAPVEVLPSNAGQDIGPTQAAEVDECQISPYICGQGICYNTAKGYTCHCNEGYRLDDAQTVCVDVNECQEQQVCARGQCRNNEGSFTCQCGLGFRVSPAGDHCDDVDECASEPDLCSSHGICRNTEGSYHCECESGFTANLDTLSCDDIDECGVNEMLCGPHGFCENSLGSFRCLCEQGYQEIQDGQGCVDVNECELLSSSCGEAQCVNTDGSFLCVCPSGQEYNINTAKCEPVPAASPVERKECYYHLTDENLCESVLTSHVTLQECCCTLGAGWGDNCEVHPCPVNGTDQFNQMCPSGKGYILSGDLLYGVPTAESYKDADECTLFGEEVCKGGFCLDTVGSYECYCKTGQDYDLTKLECRDINECLDENLCVGGECLNTDGSYMCFCTHPMVLDPSRSRCILVPEVAEQHEVDRTDYQGICWESVTETMTCTLPLASSRKTYTECCCLYGKAWGMNCALCPAKDTEDFAFMCNVHLGDGQRPYGRDALVAIPDQDYEVNLEPNEHQAALPFHENREPPYRSFEGLQAEECGILNGCENGRCVRVQEGYTCDCFDGYTLDLSRMACVDVDECSELNNRMLLCKNAKCINTIGSYQCVCLLGFTASDKPNYCVEAATHQTSTLTQ